MLTLAPHTAYVIAAYTALLIMLAVLLLLVVYAKRATCSQSRVEVEGTDELLALLCRPEDKRVIFGIPPGMYRASAEEVEERKRDLGATRLTFEPDVGELLLALSDEGVDILLEESDNA